MQVEVSFQPHKTATIKGIRELDAFDDRRFCLLTAQGEWIVYGENLQLRQYDPERKLVVIDGNIEGVVDAQAKRFDDEKEPTFWERWFG